MMRFATIALVGLAAVLTAGCSTVMAPLTMLQPEVIFETESPTVGAIKKSLAIRYLQLQPRFESGVIGFTQDGLIAMRDGSGLNHEAIAEVTLLIVEDNKERAALYREIARANGRPDWESQFRYAFAERWISRAPEGWYYRTSGGSWMKKITPVTEHVSPRLAGPTVGAPEKGRG